MKTPMRVYIWTDYLYKTDYLVAELKLERLSVQMIEKDHSNHHSSFKFWDSESCHNAMLNHYAQGGGGVEGASWKATKFMRKWKVILMNVVCTTDLEKVMGTTDVVKVP